MSIIKEIPTKLQEQSKRYFAIDWDADNDLFWIFVRDQKEPFKAVGKPLNKFGLTFDQLEDLELEIGDILDIQRLP